MHSEKNPSKWDIRICKMCGKEFQVRTCYTKRGQGKFCSISCGTRFRNIHDNPTKDPLVRKKISANHANVSGKNNPMYGRTGDSAPSWIDGRNSYSGDLWRRIAFANMKHRECEICGVALSESRELHIHHIDKNRSNNNIDNLMIVCVKCHNNILHPKKRNKLGQFIVTKGGVNHGDKSTV